MDILRLLELGVILFAAWWMVTRDEKWIAVRHSLGLGSRAKPSAVVAAIGRLKERVS